MKANKSIILSWNEIRFICNIGGLVETRVFLVVARLATLGSACRD